MFVQSNVPNKFEIKVRRNSILEDSYRIISSVSRLDLLKTKLWVEFESEVGLGESHALYPVTRVSLTVQPSLAATLLWFVRTSSKYCVCKFPKNSSLLKSILIVRCFVWKPYIYSSCGSRLRLRQLQRIPAFAIIKMIISLKKVSHVLCCNETNKLAFAFITLIRTNINDITSALVWLAATEAIKKQRAGVRPLLRSVSKSNIIFFVFEGFVFPRTPPRNKRNKST